MFQVTISGSGDHGTERRFLEAAVALVEQFGQHIDTATATTDFHADVDLTEGLSITLDAPAPSDGTAIANQGTGTDGVPAEGDGSETAPDASASPDGSAETTPDGGTSHDGAPPTPEPDPNAEDAAAGDATSAS